MSRTVTLDLVRADGTPAGELGPVMVATAWWPDAETVVRAVRDVHGLDVTILRLLDAVPEANHLYGMGGQVTYLAEVAGPLPAECRPWSGQLGDDPRRLPWARPGGPASLVAWSDGVLAARGTPRRAEPVQVRTWNLSTLWRLVTAESTVWLKAVPPFLAHEAAVISAIGQPCVPELLGAAEGKMLLAEIPGEDLYEASAAVRLEMITLLVGLQTAWLERTSELAALGAPDWRAEALMRLSADVVSRAGHTIEGDAQMALDVLIKDLPRRFDELRSCGLPDTLVHGDFHPGNLRGAPGRLVLLDWGDSGVGHPLLDLTAFLAAIPQDERQATADAWIKAWARALPASDPARAARLIEPIGALRQAVIYQGFLDRIEPSEHCYHRKDVPAWLRRAAAIATSGQ